MRSLPLFIVVVSLLLVACEPPPEPASLEDSLRETQPQIPEQALVDPSEQQLRDQMSAALQEAMRPLPAPNFALETLDGETFELSDHRGEIVVVNFWATWCAPCRKEIPDLVELQESLGEQGVQFVGISFDQTGPEEVREFADAYDINYPIAIDDGTVREAYGPIDVLPMTLIVGPNGSGRYFARGMITKEVLRPALLELLRGDAADDAPPPSYPGSQTQG